MRYANHIYCRGLKLDYLIRKNTPFSGLRDFCEELGLSAKTATTGFLTSELVEAFANYGIDLKQKMRDKGLDMEVSRFESGMVFNEVYDIGDSLRKLITTYRLTKNLKKKDYEAIVDTLSWHIHKINGCIKKLKDINEVEDEK
ncbi:hypothetical protein [Campylobacter sputorum]|uniref:hypothetical protein n=1 Tax=Campylobacter sputorum TaxID=206 RepID=UPI00053BE3CF|nr:hypothetical protein [Campylobacter sputorum]